MKIQSKTRAIDKIYKRRDRYEIPDWQRGKVWSRSKKQNLIDTLLRGWKLPAAVLHYWIVGLRLTPMIVAAVAS